jgi:hypothetical protein
MARIQTRTTRIRTTTRLQARTRWQASPEHPPPARATRDGWITRLLRWILSRRRSRLLGALTVALALLTVLIGLGGQATLNARPGHTVKVVVDEGLPWGITQEAVDAIAAEDPIRSWKPLSLRATDEYFSYDQSRGEGTENLGADVALSIHPERFRADEPEDQPEFDDIGVVASPDAPGSWRGRDSVGDTVARVYLSNLETGLGPSAVVAAARTAGEGLYTGPDRIPGLWFGLTLGGAAATLFMLVMWLRVRRNEAEVRRAFRAGQAGLARVLLEWDAAEVVIGTLPESGRPASFGRTRRRVAEETGQLVREQQRLADDLSSPRQVVWRLAAERVPDFRAGAQALADRLEALLSSAEVLGRAAGGQRVLDRIAAPLVQQSRQLQARLRRAPAGTLEAGRLELLDRTVDELLAVIQDETLVNGPDDGEGSEPGAGDSARPAGLSAQARHRWRRAEKRISAAALGVVADLERFPLGHGVEDRWLEVPEDHALAELRSSLDLGATPDGGALQSLLRAQATARALLGDLEGVDAEVAETSGRGERRPGRDDVTGRTGGGNPPRPKDRDITVFAGGLLRKGGRRGTQGLRLTVSGWALAVLLALAGAQPIAAQWADEAVPDPVWDLEGSEAVRSLVVDGPALGLERDQVLSRVDGRFSTPLDVVVAVRAAEAYLTPRPLERDAGDADAFEGRTVYLDPRGTVDGMERIRREFADRLDPSTGELREDQVVIPVYVWDDGRRSIGGAILGAEIPATYGRAGANPGSVGTEDSNALDGAIASRLVDAGQDLATEELRDYDEVRSAEATLAFVLTAALAALLVTLVAVVESLLSMAWGLRGLGGLGRDGWRLRRIRRELGRLMLGLDESRIAGVAVLGAGPAGSPREAEQRLHERSLVMAWREADALGSLTIGERLRGEAGPRLDRLERSVVLLGDREMDVAERAERVLAMAR